MRVDIVTSPALSADLFQMFLSPEKFERLLNLLNEGKALFDEVEDNLLRGAADEWTAEELEQLVGWQEPEPISEGSN